MNDFVAVRFILVEKAKKYGNVPVPAEDLALEGIKIVFFNYFNRFFNLFLI